MTSGQHIASWLWRTFRKAILSAFLLLCSHGKKNDTAMLRKFLRKVLGISLRLRKSLRKVLGIDLPTVGSRVLCTCMADIVHVLHAVQSVFGCACARNFLLWNCFLYELFRIFRLLDPGLAYFVSAAETSIRGILLNIDRWVDQLPLILLLVLTLSFTKSVLILGGMQ